MISLKNALAEQPHEHIQQSMKQRQVQEQQRMEELCESVRLRPMMSMQRPHQPQQAPDKACVAKG